MNVVGGRWEAPPERPRCPCADRELCVTRSLGVVREAGDTCGAHRWFGERGQGCPVQSEPSVRRESLLDGQAGQLVAEDHLSRLGRQHAGRQALIEMPHGLPCKSVEKPESGARGSDRDGVDQPSRRRTEAGRTGEHSVSK